jgi:hypothetical protein
MSDIITLLLKALVELQRNPNGLGARPDYRRDMVAAVPDNLLANIVRDSRVPPTDGQGPGTKVTVASAGRVVTGNDGAGWTNSPKVDDWKPPGLAIMDRMMDQQDAIDRADRAKAIAKVGGVR